MSLRPLFRLSSGADRSRLPTLMQVSEHLSILLPCASHRDPGTSPLLSLYGKEANMLGSIQCKVLIVEIGILVHNIWTDILLSAKEPFPCMTNTTLSCQLTSGLQLSSLSHFLSLHAMMSNRPLFSIVPGTHWGHIEVWTTSRALNAIREVSTKVWNLPVFLVLPLSSRGHGNLWPRVQITWTGVGMDGIVS